MKPAELSLWVFGPGSKRAYESASLEGAESVM